MKTRLLVSKYILGIFCILTPYLANALVINNGLNGATANFFAVDVKTAGSSEEVGLSPGAQVTNPSEFAPQGIIYLYNLHIIVNGTSSVLTGTAPSYVGPATDNKVTSSGNFVGSEGNTIEWTVDSSIQSGAVQMRNIITFTAVTGTLGDLQVIQYMDQDVDGETDDVFFSKGSAPQGNIELFTLDDNNPNNVGVSQGGAQLEEQGLINASFDGWGACVYGERDDFTDGSTTYSKSGVICPTLNNALPKVNHPVAGSVSASADIITTMSWTVNKNSNQSVIVSTLGGVPDAGIALAIDDYVDIVENTSTLESITFDALANDVALDIPVTFLKTSDPSDGSISLNGSVITYTPDLNYFGQDSFTYSITDNSGDSDTATIYLNVEEDTNANGVSDAEETAALEVVKNYADNGTNPKPSEITYSNLPTTGVMASNIVEINVAIESLNLVDVDTVAEIQAVIDQVISDLNTASLAELVEDLNGNANATSLTLSQLKNIVGVVGVIDDDLADYNAAFVAAPSPFADIDNPTVAEINAVIASVNAINELVEDLNGDANATVLTLIELKAIQGTEDIIDANMSGYNTAFVAAPSPFADINNPTIAEINAVIDEVNSDVALAELVEDLNGDTNATALTAEQLKDIQGVTGVVDADIADYNAAFVAAPSPFADIDNPTVAEINAVIASVNAINELVEDLNGDANATVLTLAELKAIQGLEDIIDANMASYNTAFVAAPSPFTDIDNPTVAEINAVIASVNAINELVEDLNGDANATPITAEQLKDIQGIVGVIDADIADYNAAFVAAPSPFADINNPTVAEINAVIASVNAINELVEDLNGDANATVLTLTELKAIQGLEDIIDANMSGYNTAFVAAPSPFADINNPTVAEINAVIASVNAINELVEDLNGDANTTVLTLTELKAIQGTEDIIDANMTGYNTAFVAAPSPFVDINNPTIAEINAVIASVNAINELVEDLSGDSNATPLTSEQLKDIQGVTGVVDADTADYNAAFVVTPSPFADINNPTVAEINAVIASVNAINELVEDLNGDANTTVLTLTELKAIKGTEDIIDANMAGYNTAFVAAPSSFADIDNPTIAEINAVIDEVNSDVALAELVEDLNGDGNSTPLTSEQLKDIQGVTGVVDADIADYNAAFVAAPSPFADINNPTVAEINAVIASVNAINELVEDLNGDANATVLTLTQLKDIQGTEDIIDANMAGYNIAFVAAPSPFADINNPTIAEINAVIASVNAVTELVDDLNGDGNSTTLSLVQLQSIQGVESIIAAEIDAYNAAFIAEPSPFADINNPTVNEVQAVIDAINVIVANEVAAIEELKEDIASNSNNDLVEATELNAIRGVDGALTDNQADYQAGFIATNPSPFADTNNPTAEEIQAVIDSVNVIVANETAVFAELIEDIAGDTNNGLIQASDLNSVRGISGAVDENQEAYQNAFTATTPSPFSDPGNPTAAEVQAVIAAVNNGGPDTDGDGMPDSIDNDDDNDGLLDIDETDIGRINPDQDTDGICDGNLAVTNTCVAGPDANPTNPDSDGNGICDGTIAFPATNDDSGCMPNINLNPNADSDNDGITDDSELIGDSDGDLIPDYLDADANGTAPNSGDSDKDGIDDSIECGLALPCRDSDKDGIYDHLDTDSDNDGISDDEEADGIAGNGEDLAATDGSVQPKDTDKDGKPDYRDEDSDNDGVADRDEVNQPHNPLNPKDSDNDGIPDLVDHDDRSNTVGGGDSDNDGLSDAQECPVYPTNCPDTDGDGKADYLDNNNDSDGDGIADTDEDPNFDKDNDPATNPRDTDGDGIPDYLDDDSDNDGVKDSDERNDPYDANNPRDTDGDGIPDVVDADDDGANGAGDSDGDGIPDSVECSSQPCRDTDGDGIPDYTDTDSDNDGLLDADEVGANPEQPKDTDGDGIPDIADKVSESGVESGGDSDGDGIPDALECTSWPNCIDSDNDGLADYLDNDRSPVIVREFGKVKTGVQGAGNLHWAFGLMFLLLAMRRKSAVLIAVPLMATALNVNAAWWDEMDLYAGAGIGQSYLTPSLGRSGYSVDDHTDNAWKLTAGWDWNDHISIEGYYTDLGRVSLKPGASIGYRMMGGDAILHFWAYGEERIEGSVAVYAKGGLNHMTNTGKRVSYEKNNTLQLMGGVGAEYYLPHKFSVRFEIESYDADAALFSLNLVKRFGFNSRKTKNKQPIAIVKPVPKAVVPLAVIAPVIIVLDTDKDGLLDDKDQCPNTPPGVAVNELGCAKVKEEMGDLITKLQFESSSSSLTEPSKIALNEVAALLTKYDEVQVQVQAHSDNTGSASYNKKLSQKRAESVVQYLVDKNIEISRLEPVGYGEEQPIANNNSPEGRAKNRRVEFVLK
jgi:outer membrane protein OmpA-like peptidoglycan-associated protein